MIAAREDQFHSLDTEKVGAHLGGRPKRLRQSFDKLIASLPSDVQVDALRTGIVLSAPRTFAYITVQAAGEPATRRARIWTRLTRHCGFDLCA
jgi:hypothetical protein